MFVASLVSRKHDLGKGSRLPSRTFLFGVCFECFRRATISGRDPRFLDQKTEPGETLISYYGGWVAFLFQNRYIMWGVQSNPGGGLVGVWFLSTWMSPDRQDLKSKGLKEIPHALEGRVYDRFMEGKYDIPPLVNNGRASLS